MISLNFSRNSNPKAPPITGRISTPEDPETEFNFSAFEHTDKNGESYWIGPVDMNRSMRQALNTEPSKAPTSSPSAKTGSRCSRSDHDGSPTPHTPHSPKPSRRTRTASPPIGPPGRAPKEPQLRASAWERDPRRYGPWASGNTQHPLTKEQAAALDTGKPDAADLNAPEPKRPAPRRSKADERQRA